MSHHEGGASRKKHAGSGHKIRSLELERDKLKQEVLSLAESNYARQAEIVRDRLRLREETEKLARAIKRIELRYVKPVLTKLNQLQTKLAQDAMKHEESSEAMAREFLSDEAEWVHSTSAGSYERFLGNYIELRKETSKKRILADKLAKEREALLKNITNKSGILTGLDSPRK